MNLENNKSNINTNTNTNTNTNPKTNNETDDMGAEIEINTSNEMLKNFILRLPFKRPSVNISDESYSRSRHNEPGKKTDEFELDSDLESDVDADEDGEGKDENNFMEQMRSSYSNVCLVINDFQNYKLSSKQVKAGLLLLCGVVIASFYFCRV